MTTETLTPFGRQTTSSSSGVLASRDAATVRRLIDAIVARRDAAAIHHPISASGRVFKRAIDMILAAVGLLLCAPLLLIAALVLRIDSSGPVFFRQVRLGRGGRPFSILKLRTMQADNDDSAHAAYAAAFITGVAALNDGMYKLTADPRITRVGRVLRRYSIDELPQLINVLRGHMSLVGPRPALPREVDLYCDFARQRLQVKPGITGLWQVSGRCELGFAEMIELDVSYSREWSALLDLKIIARTPAALVSGRGAA